MTKKLRWTALLTLVTSSILGCEPPPAPPAVAMPTSFVVPESRADATAQLKMHTLAFDGYIADMPGVNGGQHRKLLVNALGELSMVLRLANGRTESPEFATHVSVIDSATKVAGNPAIPRGRMEAVENQALQAASSALGEIMTRYLFDDDQLPPMHEIVGQSVSTALATVGPLHDLDATEAFRDIQAMVDRITEDMNARFGTGEAPKPSGDTSREAPATGPGAPATEPGAPATAPGSPATAPAAAP